MEPEATPKGATKSTVDGQEQEHSSMSVSKLDDEALQAEYRRAFIEQLRRRSCPGCGEEPLV